MNFVFVFFAYTVYCVALTLMVCCFHAYSDAGDSLNDCRIIFLSEIYKIEEPGSPSDLPAGSESPLKSMFKNSHCLFWAIVIWEPTEFLILFILLINSYLAFILMLQDLVNLSDYCGQHCKSTPAACTHTSQRGWWRNQAPHNPRGGRKTSETSNFS